MAKKGGRSIRAGKFTMAATKSNKGKKGVGRAGKYSFVTRGGRAQLGGRQG